MRTLPLALLPLAAAGLLAACAPPPPAPYDGAGVGFGDFADFELERARRDAALAGSALGGTGAIAPAFPAAPVPSGAAPPGGIPSADLAAAGIGVAPVATAPLGGPVIAAGPPPLSAPPASVLAPSAVPGQADYSARAGGVVASPGNAAPAVAGALPSAPSNASGISDEQDFDAVASRESIESDAQRRAEQAAQYAVVQPQALPAAPADTGPNIVAYALNAPNARGQEWYSRFAFSGEGRAARNCAGYASADEAQRDFLNRGGPERDPRGLDPDGDGFACTWDPAPFREAVGG